MIETGASARVAIRCKWTMRGALAHAMVFGDRWTLDQLLDDLARPFMVEHGAKSNTVVVDGVRILPSEVDGEMFFEAFGTAERERRS